MNSTQHRQCPLMNQSSSYLFQSSDRIMIDLFMNAKIAGGEEHSARTAGLTVSFILLLMVPLALIGLLICRGLLQKKMTEKNSFE